MQPIKRPLFICSVIEKCREKVDCCAHKIPHIKDERCVPRQCRYAPGVENVDCDQVDPEHPRVPIPEPIETRTVEEVMREKEQEEKLLKDVKEKEEAGEFVTLDEAAKELGIKEEVKKQAARRPVTITKKGGRRKS